MDTDIDIVIDACLDLQMYRFVDNVRIDIDTCIDIQMYTFTDK